MAPLVIILSFFIPLFVKASVVINEIAWMGTSVSSADEWMELKNETSSEIDLNGWRVEWKGGEYGVTFDTTKCLPGTIVPAGGYFLLERTDDNTVSNVQADCIYTGALRNEGEDLVLKDSSGGKVNEIKSAGGWQAGDNTTKETMQRQGNSWITGSSTPRAPNVGAVLGPAPQTQPPSSVPSSPATQGSSGPVVIPTISAYAGEDKKAAVGSLAELVGYAKGLNGEPLESARFWWNFGDGETKEGRAVSHIFQIPGKYTVGLHVSSGTYSASDYLAIYVSPNQIAIKSVVKGEGGYIKLVNSSDAEVDLGGWIMDDGKISFFIPPRTKLGVQAEAAFSNKITGLLKNADTKSVIIRYSNGTTALEWHEGAKIGSMVSPLVAVKSPVKIIPEESGSREIAAETTHSSMVAQSAENELPTKSEGEEKIASVGNSNFTGGKLVFILAIVLAVISSAGFVLVRKFLF